jgi:hypothetical protein
VGGKTMIFCLANYAQYLVPTTCSVTTRVQDL